MLMFQRQKNQKWEKREEMKERKKERNKSKWVKEDARQSSWRQEPKTKQNKKHCSFFRHIFEHSNIFFATSAECLDVINALIFISSQCQINCW